MIDFCPVCEIPFCLGYIGPRRNVIHYNRNNHRRRSSSSASIVDIESGGVELTKAEEGSPKKPPLTTIATNSKQVSLAAADSGGLLKALSLRRNANSGGFGKEGYGKSGYESDHSNKSNQRYKDYKREDYKHIGDNKFSKVFVTDSDILSEEVNLDAKERQREIALQNGIANDQDEEDEDDEDDEDEKVVVKVRDFLHADILERDRDRERERLQSPQGSTVFNREKAMLMESRRDRFLEQFGDDSDSVSEEEKGDDNDDDDDDDEKDKDDNTLR